MQDHERVILDSQFEEGGAELTSTARCLQFGQAYCVNVKGDHEIRCVKEATGFKWHKMHQTIYQLLGCMAALGLYQSRHSA